MTLPKPLLGRAQTVVALFTASTCLAMGGILPAAQAAQVLSFDTFPTQGQTTVSADTQQGRQLIDSIDAAALRTAKKAKDGWISRSTITDTSRVGEPPTAEDTPWLVVNTRVAVNRPHSSVGAAEVTRRVVADGAVQDAWPYVNSRWGAYNFPRGVAAWTLPPLSTPLEKEAWRVAREQEPEVEGISFTPIRAGGWELSDRPNTPEGIAHWAETNGLTPWGIVTSAALRDDLKATHLVQSEDTIVVHYKGADAYTHSGTLRVSFDKGFIARAVLTVVFPNAFTPGEYATASADASLQQLGYTTIPKVKTISEEDWAVTALQEAAQHTRATVRDLLSDSGASLSTLPSLVKIPMAGASARITVSNKDTALVRVSFRGERAILGCAMSIERGVISRCSPVKPDEENVL